VLPALKATGARVQRNLQRAGTGSAIRFGIGATVLIVAEVGLAVGFLTVGGAMSQGLVANSSADMEIEPEEYALAMVRVPWTDHSALENDLRVEEFRAEVVHAHEELLRRLSAEPGVRGVAMATALPGMGHPSRLVEVEGEARGEGFQGHEVMFARVDVGFFDGLGAEIRTGRGFTTSDLIGTERERTAVIVNSAFVQYVLGGGNPIGRHIRYVVPEGQQPGPWHEIVGVVGHLGMNELNAERDEGVYHPVAPGELHPIWTAVRVGENPLSFLPRLRAVTSDVDPDAMIQFPGSLDAPPNDDRTGIGYAILLLGFLSTVAIVLSGAGLYALMSFTVSQRTREIGIRSALGARPQNIVAAIATRAFLQLVGGVLTGLAFSAWFIPQVAGDDLTRGANWPVIIAGIAGLMITVGMLACLAPTIRGLRIRPIEALKER
jgi:hypothetical protein